MVIVRSFYCIGSKPSYVANESHYKVLLKLIIRRHRLNMVVSSFYSFATNHSKLWSKYFFIDLFKYWLYPVFSFRSFDNQDIA